MDEKETNDDEMNMDDLHGNQKETVELASATEDADRYIKNQSDDDSSAEEEESDDEEEDDTEETYSLTSEGEINPLALTEFDPYQHSEHMEYEALADKKRKAILDHDDEGMPLGKKLRLEEYAPAELDELMAELTGRKRRSKKVSHFLTVIFKLVFYYLSIWNKCCKKVSHFLKL
ncbi:hypothetical protein Hanom_Chr09g00851111 [Helianthus anomalus]